MDDILYITELGGHVHCLDANSGELYWTENMFANTLGHLPVLLTEKFL